MKRKIKVKRTERGWAGHFICADRCLFRRNTLLEAKDTRIVISSVGLMKTNNDKEKPFDTVGRNRYFETMAFHAQRVQDRYWDIEVSKQVRFDSPWCIADVDADDRANDMHEKVVEEITERLSNGEQFEEKQYAQ